MYKYNIFLTMIIFWSYQKYFNKLEIIRWLMPGVFFQLFHCYIVRLTGKKSSSTKTISSTNLIYKIMFLMVCCSLMHAHMDTLCSHLLATTCILIVSNVAAQLDRSGTCAWTIWANSELWSGKGHVPVLPDDMYLGLAEAFGIYMALSFSTSTAYIIPWSQPKHAQFACTVTTKEYLIGLEGNQPLNTLVMPSAIIIQYMQNSKQS